MTVVDITEKFTLITDYWTPKKVGQLNSQQVLLAKLKGSFVMHTHAAEDEFFMVHKGVLDIYFKDNTHVTIKEGQFYIVPKGVAHKPIAKEEVHVVLFEPLAIKHTGNVVTDLTVNTFESI
jgi:Mannose-6-phosphate isomerase